jgi:hypothetical protein
MASKARPTSTFLPSTRDGSTRFQVDSDTARRLYNAGLISWDVTNSCYCPRNRNEHFRRHDFDRLVAKLDTNEQFGRMPKAAT